MTRGAAAILLGAALLAVALMTAVSVGSTGTGWGEGGALAMLRLPRVLAAGAAAATDDSRDEMWLRIEDVRAVPGGPVAIVLQTEHARAIGSGH
ncbi:MAG: hypothetical protein ACO268_08820, partial [Opitutales bacterium]